ncbi:hypothetical protein M0811_06846 [Anaeramoeba ignava]|uniref:Uncharacterized protein n=1 Tax=Anaeramoeba ignava TaxID=1746090 RepID=A0A9Q0RDC8_ANAIG|nr:hypothetical protein M0811_06846 [Anaeramoeba ignava]|eukprot:Anaeramoba_ignava/a218374_226.p1 GENE.a218374_226~~a218374_226.p1  ORF type:complete len:286 (+),score=66.43 a218374_226:27-884(+)
MNLIQQLAWNSPLSNKIGVKSKGILDGFDYNQSMSVKSEIFKGVSFQMTSKLQKPKTVSSNVAVEFCQEFFNVFVKLLANYDTQKKENVTLTATYPFLNDFKLVVQAQHPKKATAQIEFNNKFLSTSLNHDIFSQITKISLGTAIKHFAIQTNGDCSLKTKKLSNLNFKSQIENDMFALELHANDFAKNLGGSLAAQICPLTSVALDANYLTDKKTWNAQLGVQRKVNDNLLIKSKVDKNALFQFNFSAKPLDNVKLNGSVGINCKSIKDLSSHSVGVSIDVQGF